MRGISLLQTKATCRRLFIGSNFSLVRTRTTLRTLDDASLTLRGGASRVVAAVTTMGNPTRPFPSNMLQPHRGQQQQRRCLSSTSSSPPPPPPPPPLSQHEPYVSKGNDDSTSTTHFGFTEVNIHEKEEKVRQVFANVADSYDVMNDVMSAGVHRLWKDYLLDVSCVAELAAAARASNTEFRILDVAGGTGDVAFRFIEAANAVERAKSSGIDNVSVTVCDINHDMLRVGEQRARDRFGSAIMDSGSQALRFMQGNAQDLQPNFADNTFDLYTIAFGLRNVTDVDKALVEARRVLKPGGRFMCLEFSHVPQNSMIPFLRQIYDTYSFQIIPWMGQMVANDRASYQYLVESIRRFSNQDELLQRMKTAGFTNTRYTNLTGGIVALHEGWKEV